MTIQQDYQLRPHIEREFTATGIIGPDTGIPLNMTGNVRVALENVSGTNEVEVQGRLVGQSSWVTVSTIVGSTTGTTVDMSVYDEVRFNCSVYSASGGTPKLLASGFFKRGGGASFPGYFDLLFAGADYFSATYPTVLQDVWTFKDGGSGGTTVATITLNYSDAARTDPSEGTIT